jgi:hypothetical protein
MQKVKAAPVFQVRPYFYTDFAVRLASAGL